MFNDGVGVVGLVREKDDGGIRFGRDGEIEVRVACAGIFETAEPDARAVFLDGDVLVDQHRSAMGGESVDDHRGIKGHVVVAEDGIAEGSCEGGDDLGAAVDGMIAGDEGERAVGDEVSGKQDKIRGEGVGHANDVLEKVWLGVLVEVNVAELYDAIAMEGAGKVGDWNRTMDDVDLMPGDLTCVEGHSCGQRTGADEEVASGKARRLIGLRTGHRS